MSVSQVPATDPFHDDPDPETGYNRLWINLLRVQRSTMARVARELRAHGIGDPLWSEILVQLDRAGEAGIVMSELEQRLMCPQYSLSRHIARMEELGYVRGAGAKGPGRAKKVTLTSEGRAKMNEIDPIFSHIMQQEFSTRLSTEEAYDMVRYLIRLYP